MFLPHYTQESAPPFLVLQFCFWRVCLQMLSSSGCLCPDRGEKWTSSYWRCRLFQVLISWCFSNCTDLWGQCRLLPDNHPYRKPNYSKITSTLCTESSPGLWPTCSPRDNLHQLLTWLWQQPSEKPAISGQHRGLTVPINRLWGWEVHVPVAAHSHLLIPNAICSSPNLFSDLIRNFGTSGDWRA